MVDDINVAGADVKTPLYGFTVIYSNCEIHVG
jgi:hypothetical protein